MRPFIVLGLLACIVYAGVVVARGGAVVCHRPTAYDMNVRLPREWPRYRVMLHRFFGNQWNDAAVVSFGESSWHPDATNGCYLGYFQMGCMERETTGWTADVAGQVRAAAKWNSMNGGQWSRWDCKP